MLKRLNPKDTSGAAVNLTAQIRDYSVYTPSMQINSAKRVRAKAEAWQDAPLPNGLTPKDFDYLRSDNRFWTYKYALASAESFRSASGSNAVTAADSTTFILGDSGGYQIGKGTFKGASDWKDYDSKRVQSAWFSADTRTEIIRWCESRCDYAMTIDIPLWVNRPNEKNSPFRRCSTEEIIALTVDNLKLLATLRGRWTNGQHECKYLNVLQGETEQEEQLWFDAVSPFKFDGWSFAGSVGVDGGPYRILKRLLLLADKNLLDDGYNWLHLLKLSQPKWAPFVTAIQRAVRKNINPRFTVSYDSSTPYQQGGARESYYSAQPFTSDPKTWVLSPHKMPSRFSEAVDPVPMALTNKSCAGRNPCAMCRKHGSHIPAPMLSPLTANLTVQDLLEDKEKMAGRRSGPFFDEVLINHNVFVITKAMIDANHAVFETPENAPPQLVDACGEVERLFENRRGWEGRLRKTLPLLESAVGYSKARPIAEAA